MDSTGKVFRSTESFELGDWVARDPFGRVTGDSKAKDRILGEDTHHVTDAKQLPKLYAHIFKGDAK